MQVRWTLVLLVVLVVLLWDMKFCLDNGWRKYNS